MVAAAALLMARREARQSGGAATGQWHVEAGGRSETVTLHPGADATIVDLDWRSEAARLSWEPGDTLARLDWSDGRVAVLKVNPTTSGFRIRTGART